MNNFSLQIFKNKENLGIVLSNLFLVFGALFLGYDVKSIIAVYWAENLIIGFINVLKMVFANPKREKLEGVFGEAMRGRNIPLIKGTMFLVPFFIVHYGIFCFGHAAFINGFFFKGLESMMNPISAVLGSIPVVGLLLLLASHLFSFYKEFFVNNGREKTMPIQLMFAPYKRIVVLHIAIMIIGIFALKFQNPIFMLLVLVVLKIIYEIKWSKLSLINFGK